ncbi:MAG TPA: tellurite resistance/C4-dicarboxylate transporter family protein [Dissulfurispiraceae bacterium]
MKEALGREIAGLFPGYFALVMATGIISIATHLLDMDMISRILAFLNKIFFTLLWLLTLARLVRYPHRFLADLTSHVRGPAFFTFVAGTCVLGSQLVIIEGDYFIGEVLWGMGCFLWLVLIYTFLSAMAIRREKPGIEKGISGTWLITVVATQSVSVLGALIAPSFGPDRAEILFISLALFLLGCMFYIMIITFIFYRLVFFTLEPEAFTPPYWITMGAAAITTLAGALLIQNVFMWTLLRETEPFLKGFTLFFWASATWWTVLIAILDLWRYLVGRVPLRYDPLNWSMVFPLGMYTVCTFQLAKAEAIGFLLLIPRIFIYIALLAWIAAFAGLVIRIAGIFTNRT